MCLIGEHGGVGLKKKERKKRKKKEEKRKKEKTSKKKKTIGCGVGLKKIKKGRSWWSCLKKKERKREKERRKKGSYKFDFFYHFVTVTDIL